MRSDEFKKYYDKYFKFAAQIAYRIVKDIDIAQDIGQEALYRLYRYSGDLDMENDRKVGAWVKKTAVHLALDYMKKGFVKYETLFMTEEAEESVPDRNSDVEALLLRMEMNEYLRLILEKYYRTNRLNCEILIEVKFLDIPPEQVAMKHGMTVNSVNNRVHRAKQWLIRETSRFYFIYKP
jgi:RNA polymerase sigma factor (sigma-70 family)